MAHLVKTLGARERRIYNIKKFLFLVFTISIGMIFSASVYADVISFTDNRIYWPNWGNNTTDDSQDSIGIPNFLGGTVTIQGSSLTSITFNYTGTITNGWGILQPGDLFIDVGANKTWDYIIRPSTK